jgi:hypothetical protein
MNIADMRSFGFASIPVLEQIPQGSWRGWARYRDGEWSGEYDIQNARLALDGMADALRIQSALVKLSVTRVAVNRLRARIGKVEFTGDYRWEPDAVRPHRFNIAIAQVDASEIARVMAPTLARERGFLARTLRLGPAPVPEWLKERRADGTLSISSLSIGDSSVRLDKARLLWDGAALRLAGMDAHIEDTGSDGGAIAGDMEISLAGRVPHYTFNGKAWDLPYKGGKVDLEGTFEADGLGEELLDTARAEGRLRGRSISFASEVEFRSAAACFEMQGPVWKLSTIEVSQGAETYLGSGATQPDGKLVLDLAKGGRQVRFAGTLFAAAP